MKRFYSYLLSTLLLQLLLFSCSSNDSNVLPEISISKQEISFAKAAGQETIYISTNVDVAVSSDKEWCTVSKINSTSSTTLKYSVSVTENSDTDIRSAVISVKGGETTETISVKQEAGTSFILAKSSYSISGDGGTIEVEIKTSGDYSFTINNEDWIHHSDNSRAISDKKEQFSVDKNFLTDKRSGTITFVMSDITETVTITQDGISVPEGDKTGMSSDALVLASKMKFGWNLGNSLEVPGNETLWGNPKTTKAMIDAVKKAGFNSIRIPCSWNKYIVNESTYEINSTWLARVKEVVDYCISNDMYTIINIHYDDGWLENNCTTDKQVENVAKQRALWYQIASYFRDYDEHLLFAGCNEPNVSDEIQMNVLKSYEQAFIDAVRSTGGKNAYRNLIVQGPSTDIDKTDNLMSMPTDIVSNRLFLEVHYYSPYQFTLMTEDASWGKMDYFWGKDYKQYAVGDYDGRWDTWGGEDYVKEEFDKMKKKFVDKGIPVILGEYGAIKRNLSSNQKEHEASRAYFVKYVTEQSINYGMIPFYWDNGADDLRIFNRTDGMSIADKLLYDQLIEGSKKSVSPY